MPETFFQPVEVISEVLHAENQASIGAEPQRVVLHHIIHLDQLSDIWHCREREMAEEIIKLQQLDGSLGDGQIEMLGNLLFIYLFLAKWPNKMR